MTRPYDPDTAAAFEMLGPPIGIFRVFARRAISYVARATRLAPEPGAPLFAGVGP